MADYCLSIKPSAAKELLSILDKAPLTRLIEKVKSLATQPPHHGLKSSRADLTFIVSVKVTIESFTPSMMRREFPTLLRLATEEMSTDEWMSG